MHFSQQWDSFYSSDRNYYYETAEALPDETRFAGGIEKAQVCIIGGGFSGLTTAIQLRQRGLDVTLIERHKIGFGASGRCGGQLIPGFQMGLTEITEKYGAETAGVLWEKSLDALDLIKRWIADFGIECDLKPGVAIAAPSDRSFEKITQLFQRNPLFAGYGYEYIDCERSSAILGTSCYKGIVLDMNAAHFHPYKYLLGLARAARRSGVRIYERTAAEDIGFGAPHKILCNGGIIEAEKIAVCGDAYVGNLIPMVRRKHILVRTEMVVTEPLGASMRGILPDDVAVYEAKNLLYFFRRFPGTDRLLWGGGDSASTITGSQRAGGRIRRLVLADMRKTFPQLADARITHKWGGYLAVSTNSLPYLINIENNVYACGGYSGHGIVPAHLFGTAMAEVLSTGNIDPALEKITPGSFPGGGRYDKALGMAGLTLARAKDLLGVY